MPPDIGSVSWSEVDASNSQAPPAGWQPGMFPNQVEGVGQANMGGVKRFWDRINSTKTTDAAGTSTNYTLTYAVAAAAYYNGEEFSFILDKTCGAAPTLNINSLGAYPFRKFSGGAWANLAAGDALANVALKVRYNSAVPSFDIVAMSMNAADFVQSSLLTTRGDLLVEGATGPQRLGLGLSGQALSSNGTDAIWSPIVFRSYLAGLTLSAAGGVNNFGVAAGVAADSGNAVMLNLASAVTKTTAAWAAGTGNGSLDTGVIAANTWYHAWLIGTANGATVDVLVSLSPTAPTMPATYTLKRRIGAMKTDGSSNWIAFLQYGDRFLWKSPPTDQNAVAVGTTGTNYTISVPTGLTVNALVRIFATAPSSGTSYAIYSPNQTAETIASNQQPPANLIAVSGVSGNAAAGNYEIVTNTSSQIAAVGSATGTITMVADGWVDTRGRDL